MSFNFDTFGTTTSPKAGSFDLESFGTDAGPLESTPYQSPLKQGFLRGETTFPVDRNDPASLNFAKSIGNIPSSYMKMAGGVFDFPEIYSTGKELLAQNEGSVGKTSVAVAKSALQDLGKLAKSGFSLWKQMGESIYETLENNVEIEGSVLKGAYEGTKQVGAEALGKVAEMALNDPLLIPSLLYAPRAAGKGDLISDLAKPVSTKIEAGLERRALSGETSKLKRVELQNKDLRTTMDLSPDAHAGTRERIMRSGVLEGAINEDGVITTTGKNGPMERYRKMTIDDNEGVVRDMLKVEYETDPSIFLTRGQIRKALETEIRNTTGLEGKTLRAALNNIPKEIAGIGERLEGKKIPLWRVQNAKIAAKLGVNYQRPATQIYAKAVARAYRKLIEKTSKLNVGEVNKVLGKFEDDISFLKTLNGKRVPGGKLGVMTSQIMGTVAGAGAGALLGGIPGLVAGGVVGPAVSKAIKQRSLKRYFNGKARPMEKSPVLENAREYAQSNKKKSTSKTIQVTKTVKSKSTNKDISKTIPQKKGIVSKVVEKAKKYNKDNLPGLAIKDVGDEATVLNRATKYLREAKGLSASDIMKKYPEIQLKRDVPVKNIHGQKQVIPEGEVLTPYELKGNKVLLQDGKTYVVSKNQFQNVKGQSLSGEAKEFAPELKGTEETVKTETARQKLGRGGVGGTKYSSYTLPGGKNYKEILVKAPDVGVKDVKKLGQEYGNRYAVVGKDGKAIDMRLFDTEAEAKSYAKTIGSDTAFKSSHWDELNVLFHTRLNERTYNGKKVTFLEEIQSDWAKEGRSKGFIKEPTLPANLQRYKSGDVFYVKDPDVDWSFNGKSYAEAEKKFLLNEKNNMDIDGAIPNNPLLKNWQTLAVKRALKEAMANKSDYFAWINGEQTSARYNLATQVKEVKWKKSLKQPDGSYGKQIDIHAQGGGGNSLIVVIDKNGVIKNATDRGQGWSGKKLDEVLGKGLADSIMAKESGTLSGEGLKFGGEWANNLYDKQVGNIVSDLTGAKVEKLDMGLPIENKTQMFVNVDDTFVSPKDLEVGKIVIRRDGGGQFNRLNQYIITDVLKDGKFKAAHVNDGPVADAIEANNLLEIPERAKMTFDISSKTTTQQGIRLTPEIKRIIRGESPIQPLEKFLAVRNRALNE